MSTCHNLLFNSYPVDCCDPSLDNTIRGHVVDQTMAETTVLIVVALVSFCYSLILNSLIAAVLEGFSSSIINTDSISTVVYFPPTPHFHSFVLFVYHKIQ